MSRVKRNFLVKTVDGKVGAVQRALKTAGIDVVSVIEVFKEDLPEEGADGDAAVADSGESAPFDA